MSYLVLTILESILESEIALFNRFLKNEIVFSESIEIL